MKTIFRSLTGAVLLVALLTLPSCRKQDSQANSGRGDLAPVNIHVTEVRPTRLVDVVEAAGIVKAIEDVTMSPEEGGLLKKWLVQKGQHVSKGVVLGILNDDVIKAGYEAAEAQYNMAELNARKQKEVYDQQGISELQYKNLLYGRDAAKANAELMKARYERTRLRSPIDGVLEDMFVDEGEFCAPGMPIARVVNTSRVKVQAEVPEHFANSFRVGAGARMTFDAAPGDTIRATISFTGSTVSPINRSLTVEILLPNEHGKLKPEMIAKVLLERESKANAIMISENVIQLVDRDRRIVFVEKGGKAEERRLTLGGREGNLVEVLDGLQPGDRLITVGYQKLVNGQPVVINQ